MKITLYMAISADGYIAGPHDETPWSDAEWEVFQEFVKTCNIVLLGRRTYEIMRRDGDFVEGPEYIIVTDNQSLDTGTFRKLAITSKADMPTAERIAIIGGGDLNGRLAKLGIIDEVILDVEPIMLGSGIRLFGDHEVRLKLELTQSRRIGEGTVQNHYRIVREET